MDNSNNIFDNNNSNLNTNNNNINNGNFNTNPISNQNPSNNIFIHWLFLPTYPTIPHIFSFLLFRAQ